MTRTTFSFFTRLELSLGASMLAKILSDKKHSLKWKWGTEHKQQICSIKGKDNETSLQSADVCWHIIHIGVTLKSPHTATTTYQVILNYRADDCCKLLLKSVWWSQEWILKLARRAESEMNTEQLYVCVCMITEVKQSQIAMLDNLDWTYFLVCRLIT